MREYAKLAPTLWTGETGKALRKKGPEALIVAVYLMSSPHSNMLGLYYQPVMYMAHETGLGIEGASKGLLDCIEASFCSYDADTEMVYVHEMAAYQIGTALSPGDKRCKGIQKDYDALHSCPFLASWFDRYCADFNLTTRRENKTKKLDGTEAPSMPHRSQEQEQRQRAGSVHREILATRDTHGRTGWRSAPQRVGAIRRTPTRRTGRGGGWPGQGERLGPVAPSAYKR